MAFDFDLFVIGAGSVASGRRVLRPVSVREWQWLKAVIWVEPA